MAMVVKNNMSAVNTLNTLNKNQSALGLSLAKVSSGQKINTAQDDASGYAISERMRVMVRALDQAVQNTQNGSSMMKVAEGAVGKTVEILKTLKEKAINAATDTNTDDDRATIQKEIDQFVDQIDDNALVTFNGKYLIDGSKAAKSYDTPSVLLNQSLQEDLDTSTKLVDLKDRSGNSLNIVEGDTIKVGFYSQGKFGYLEDITVQDEDTFTLYNIFKALSGDSTAINDLGLDDGLLGELFTDETSAFYNATASDRKFLTVSTYTKVVDAGTDTTSTETGAIGGLATNTTVVNAASAIFNDGKQVIGQSSSGVDQYIPDGKAGVVLTSSIAGLKGQISSLSITVYDQNGKAKKSANEHLEFKTQIFASNKQYEDHSLNIQTGAAAGQVISMGMLDMRAEALGLRNADATVLKVSTPARASAAIAAFDSALQKALDQATTIGAIEARLTYTADNLTTSSENVQSAESTIRDADMAKEMTNYTKNNVLLQAAQSMLAQANQNSSAVLSLLQ